MTRDEFLSLPPGVALDILLDALNTLSNGKVLLEISAREKPRIASSPKYDQIIYTRGGIQWASELDMQSLLFWKRRAQESADSGGQYAEKDAKKAKALAYWIEWRKLYPTTAWTGERNRRRVTAAVPQYKAAVYEREPRAGETREAEQSDYGFDDSSTGSGAFNDDSEIPF